MSRAALAWAVYWFGVLGLAASWPAWVEWYGSTDLVPPPGFTGWKGQLLSLIDPRFSEFLTEQAPSRIRVEEILWVG